MLLILVLLVTDVAFGLDCEPVTVSPQGSTVGPICDGGQAVLKCPAGQLISITYAFWGRESTVYCNYSSTDSTTCVAQNASEIVIDSCNNQCTCLIGANSDIFGDPCPGTSKYLVILWTCVPITKCCRCESFDVAANTCEASCPSSNNQTDCQVQPGCMCKPGYLRDTRTNNCVRQDKCPIYFPQYPNVTTDEVYDSCGPAFERSCQYPELPSHVDRNNCVPGYRCARPLYRDLSTGLCVPKKDCECICDGSSSSSSESNSNEECPEKPDYENPNYDAVPY